MEMKAIATGAQRSYREREDKEDKEECDVM